MSGELKVRSVDEIHELLPMSETQKAFMARPDIAQLPTEDQAIAWAEHRRKLQGFLDFLTQVPTIVVEA